MLLRLSYFFALLIVMIILQLGYPGKFVIESLDFIFLAVHIILCLNSVNFVLQMAKELDAILDHGEAYLAESCKMENGSVNFLEKVIQPIYDTMVEVSRFSELFLFL